MFKFMSEHYVELQTLPYETNLKLLMIQIVML